MYKVFIDGQAGTTGLQIAQRLAKREDIQLLTIDSDLRKDVAARLTLMQDADVTIWCLPDTAVAEAATIVPEGCRVLDASSVHRVHADWTYGLPEMGAAQRAAIAGSSRVSNPGCYPQGFILWVRPLIDAGLLPADLPLSVNAVSGYSGGGRGMIERYTAFTPQQAEQRNTQLYGLTLRHKHLPEMHAFSGCNVAPIFVPSVANYAQGMLTQIPIHLSLLRTDAERLLDTVAERYADEPLIHVHPLQAADCLEDGYLGVTARNDTDAVDLMLFASEHQALLVARYDNLGKGAAGCAVQNLNLMLGVEECRSLRT